MYRGGKGREKWEISQKKIIGRSTCKDKEGSWSLANIFLWDNVLSRNLHLPNPNQSTPYPLSYLLITPPLIKIASTLTVGSPPLWGPYWLTLHTQLGGGGVPARLSQKLTHFCLWFGLVFTVSPSKRRLNEWFALPPSQDGFFTVSHRHLSCSCL